MPKQIPLDGLTKQYTGMVVGNNLMILPNQNPISFINAPFRIFPIRPAQENSDLSVLPFLTLTMPN